LEAKIFYFSDYYQSGRYSEVLKYAAKIKRTLTFDPIEDLFLLSQVLLELEPDDYFNEHDKQVFLAYHDFLSLYQTTIDKQRLLKSLEKVINACYHRPEISSISHAE
jgi:hypothetical protein